MKKHYNRWLLLLVRKFRTAPLIIIAVLLLLGSAYPYVHHFVLAAANCSTIAECQAQIDQNNQKVADLQSVATNYQDAIKKLQSQIESIQKQLVISQNRETQLQSQINANQLKLNQQKTVLGEDLKSMYVSGQMTTVEMLATSKNLSDFVNAETYDSAVQNKIQDTMNQITALQNELQSQQEQVQQLIASQQAQQADIASAQSQKQQLLSYNESQQSAYNAQTAQNQQKLDDLIAAQLLANSGSGNGAIIAGATSYPYANWPFSMSTAPGCVNGDGPDAWGYCTRQCVSYAAWAVAHSGRQAPVDWGDARDWVAAALKAGVPVYSFNNVDGYSGVHTGGPRDGDVAISTAGAWGHAMYIEDVSGTQIYVSQYNANLDGEFSHQWRDASNYYFIRFPY
jgi:peptidoglycan DL-endopeptidase CwlO